MSNIETNSHGVNKLIKATILSDEEMREIGFTDFAKNRWYFGKNIKFPKSRFQPDISFDVTIPKDGSDINIEVIDEDFGQPYDYQYILEKTPNFEPCLVIKEQVEDWMTYLQNKGVLSGHVYGEYI